MERFELPEACRQELIRLRRHFHTHPELSLDEAETSRYVRQYLESIGLRPIPVGQHGLVATVYGNSPCCKTVAVRAEMDALAVTEKNDLPWKSRTPGIMHACGHDGILACTLMLARRCVENAEKLPVNVKFLFQSAEENGKGTQIMLDGGAMENPHADYFIMYHFVNDAPMGVEFHWGASSAAIGSVAISVHGKASHWCSQDMGVDSIGAAANLVQSIGRLNRSYQSDSPFVVGIGTIQGGTAKNIIAEQTCLEGTLRAYRTEDYFNLRALLFQIFREAEAEYGVKIEAQIDEHPILPIVNDDALVELGLKVGRPMFGEECRISTVQYLSGDSASAYFDHARGIFLVFTAEKAGSENFPLHNGRFDFDEDILEKATVFLFDYLKNMPV